MVKITHGEYDKMWPISALVASTGHGQERTVLIYMQKAPNVNRSNNNQERHLARCLEVPLAIQNAYLNRHLRSEKGSLQN